MISQATLGIAVLLAVGLGMAKLGQLIRLPSVTGFILAGLLLGPSGFGVITAEMVGHKLDHFTQIALMLIAFGIGEHVELRKLGNVAKDVAWIAIAQAVAAFILVAGGVWACTLLIINPGATGNDNIITALLLGAVAVATAPAAILHIARELNARGPFTSTLLAVVAVDDGLAIMIFGMAVSAAHQLTGAGGTPVDAVLAVFFEIGGSIAIGVVTGLFIDFILHKLHNRGEMMTAGLTLLLLCGELTNILHLSPLLAGMMAGFTIINRAERDVRLFRALNAFEPPIYILFFTLAGVHLDLSALKPAGVIGLVYFITRIIGKYFGSWLGGVMSGASNTVRRYLGLALLPQAGVAIGLVFMISSDPQLSDWSIIITPVVLAGVVLSELGGPILARLTIEKAGEAGTPSTRTECQGRPALACDKWLRSSKGISLTPWQEKPLQPAANAKGTVAFIASHVATVRILARIATILSHHYHTLPMSVRVLKKNTVPLSAKEQRSLFLPETDEARQLGYPLLQKIIFDDAVSGLVTAEYSGAKAIVIGYPLGRRPLSLQRIIDKVAANVSCPVIAVRFVGTMAWERILVPFLFFQELEELLPIIEAMAIESHPCITFQLLVAADLSEEEIQLNQQRLQEWLDTTFFAIETKYRVVAAESRLEAILQETSKHDLVIMTAARRKGMQRSLFGSLADAVVNNCRQPVFVVHFPPESGRHMVPYQ